MVSLAACGASPRRQPVLVGNAYAGTGYGGAAQVGGGQGGGQGGNYIGASPSTGQGAGPRASGDARNQLNQLDQLFRSRGYSQVGPALHGNLPFNGVIAYAVNVAPGACYAIFALGEDPAQQDINIVVTDQSMRTIDHDVRPDAHPWVLTCPNYAGRMTVRVQMVRGAGSYFYGVYQGAASAPRPDLASFFGTATAQMAAAQLDQATGQRVQNTDRALAAERFQRVTGPTGLPFTEGGVQVFPLTLMGGVCYAFATWGGPGARDTDAFIVDAADNAVAQDQETHVDALVRYCPPQPGQYRLKVRMYQGAGPVFVAAYMQQGQGATVQNPPPTGGQQGGGGVIAGAAQAGGGVEDNFRLVDGEMRARGYESFGDAQRGRLAEGEQRDFPLQLEGGKCYAILAVGDSGVRDLDLRLDDANGRLVDRDVDTDSRPIVRVCPERTGRFVMHVSMFRGEGNFVYQPYRWPRGVRGPFGLAGVMYVRLAEMTQLLSVEGYQVDTDIDPERGTFRREGEEREHELTLAANRCYAVVAVGGEGVTDIDLTLLRGNAPLQSDGTRNPFPSVRHCTDGQGGRFKLKVRAAAGSGAYFFQIFNQAL